MSASVTRRIARSGQIHQRPRGQAYHGKRSSRRNITKMELRERMAAALEHAKHGSDITEQD